MKKLWKWLKGKKRNIGIILLSLLDVALWVFPEQIPPQHYASIVSLINILLLGGLADSEDGKKIIKNSYKLLNKNK